MLLQKEHTTEEINSLCEAMNKFGLTLEESIRCIDVLSKNKSTDFIKSTPKTYGQSLIKKK